MNKRRIPRKKVIHARRVPPNKAEVETPEALEIIKLTAKPTKQLEVPIMEDIVEDIPKEPKVEVAVKRVKKQATGPSWVAQTIKVFVCLILACVSVFYLPPPAETDRIGRDIWGIEIDDISKSISPSLNAKKLPELVKLQVGNKQIDADVHYTINERINTTVDELLNHYKPDFGSVVAIEPKTGRILALSSFIRDGERLGNLSFHAHFPAASVFKIITAAAALDKDIATPKTVYEYNGKNSSLYKKNVLRHKSTSYSRTATLTKAFALSINTVFGRIGIFDVGGESLGEYANSFGFNRQLTTDIALNPSKTQINLDDDWSIAEAASGYTRKTTISPLHAAMVAAAIVNDGVMIEPRVVDYVNFSNGPLVYEANPASEQPINQQSAQEMRVLMRETVLSGSARKVFRGFFKNHYKDLDVGGKTGSLTGTNPKGKTQWFVGYGDSGTQQIAVAAVVVNKEKWRVKPALLVRKVIEEFFKPTSNSG